MCVVSRFAGHGSKDEGSQWAYL